MIARTVALLLLSAPSAAAWATRSAADGPLGPARWSLSHDPLDAPNAGLGRGLTLNVNLDELCTRLLPQFAEAHPTNFIRCADVQQDVLLAAASWSHVHPRVAFVEHRGVGPAAEARLHALPVRAQCGGSRQPALQEVGEARPVRLEGARAKEHAQARVGARPRDAAASVLVEEGLTGADEARRESRGVQVDAPQTSQMRCSLTRSSRHRHRRSDYDRRPMRR